MFEDSPRARSTDISKLTARLTRSAQIDMAELKEDERAWVDVLTRFRELQSSEKTAMDLRNNVIPPLDKQVIEESVQLDKVQEEVEEVCFHSMFHANLVQAKLKVQRAKIGARDLQTLKSAAALVTRNLGEIKDLQSDIARLERDLEGTGSLKTVEDVQREVDQLSNHM